MKRVGIFFFAFALILFASPLHGADPNRWFPFTLSQMADDSPVNLGKLVLDAPAGKHGFIQRKGDHFVYEDGSRAKFWGINLYGQVTAPDYAEGERLADRLAFFGFNSVHLLTLDNYESWGLLYKDPDSSKQDTRTVSTTQLDKMDYFFNELKKRGIYVMVKITGGRKWHANDGVVDAAALLPPQETEASRLTSSTPP